MKIVLVQKDKVGKIDLSNEKQMKELFDNHGVEVDTDKEPNFVLDKDGKKWYPSTFTGIFESPDKLFKEGRHPNQAFMEQMFGKP